MSFSMKEWDRTFRSFMNFPSGAILAKRRKRNEALLRPGYRAAHVPEIPPELPPGTPPQTPPERPPETDPPKPDDIPPPNEPDDVPPPNAPDHDIDLPPRETPPDVREPPNMPPGGVPEKVERRESRLYAGRRLPQPGADPRAMLSHDDSLWRR